MNGILVLAAACLAAIFFLSLLETAVIRLSRVALRVLADRERDHGIALLEDLAQDRMQFLLPLQFAIQVLTAGVAVLVTVLSLQLELPYPLLLARVRWWR